MYTLRTIKKNDPKKVYNQNLGENYTVVYKERYQENSQATKNEEGEKLSKQLDDFDILTQKCIINHTTYAIVVANNGELTIPLFGNQDYYIMTEGGKTFEKL